MERNEEVSGTTTSGETSGEIGRRIPETGTKRRSEVVDGKTIDDTAKITKDRLWDAMTLPPDTVRAGKFKIGEKEFQLLKTTVNSKTRKLNAKWIKP